MRVWQRVGVAFSIDTGSLALNHNMRHCLCNVLTNHNHHKLADRVDNNLRHGVSVGKVTARDGCVCKVRREINKHRARVRAIHLRRCLRDVRGVERPRDLIQQFTQHIHAAIAGIVPALRHIARRIAIPVADPMVCAPAVARRRRARPVRVRLSRRLLALAPHAVLAVEVALCNVARCVAVVVVDPRRWAALRTVGHGPGKHNLLSARARVKILWPHVEAKHDVVVEVQELCGEPRDAVDVRLNCRGRERGQVRRVGENLLVRHNAHTGVVEVQPVWDLPVGDNVHVPHPGRVHFERSQGVQQL